MTLSFWTPHIQLYDEVVYRQQNPAQIRNCLYLNLFQSMYVSGGVVWNSVIIGISLVIPLVRTAFCIVAHLRTKRVLGVEAAAHATKLPSLLILQHSLY